MRRSLRRPESALLDRRAILLLVAGVALSPLAHAQFANVSLYGSLNLDVEVVNGAQSDGSNPSIVRVSSNSSRFGLRGHEYLGRGQVAIFQLESDGPGRHRRLGACLARDLGRPSGRLGHVQARQFPDALRRHPHDLRQFADVDDVDPFDRGPVGAGCAEQDRGRIRRAARQLVRYETPPLQGFSAALQFATRDTSDDPNGGDNGDRLSELRHANVISGGAFYNNGPLDLGIAYERNYRIRPTGPTDDALVDHRRLRFRHGREQCRPAGGRRLRAAQVRHADRQPDARLLRTVDDAGGRRRHVLRLLGQGRRRQGQRGRRHDDRSAGQRPGHGE